MIEKKNSRHSAWLYIISGLAIIGIIAGFFWQNIKYELVRRKLSTAISGKSAGLYRLSYKNLVIDEVAGNISVEDVHLATDSSVYLQLSKGDNPPARIDISIPKMVITGVKTPKALLNKELEGHSINIQSAVIQLTTGKQGNNSSKTKLVDEIYEQVLGNLQRVKADSLNLQDITFIMNDPESGKAKFEGRGFSCGLADILIDSLHQNDSSRILFAKEISIRCNNLSLNSKDKQFKYIFSGLDYNSTHNLLQVEKILIQPQLSESAFAAQYKYSKDRYDFTIENLAIRHVDRFALFNQRLIADSVTLGNSSFKIFRDITLPHDTIDRTDTYPQNELMKLGLPLDIHKLIFEHAFIEYKEKHPKSDSSGKVQFYAVHAVLSNVTNIPGSIVKNNKMRLDFQSRFLNKASMHAELIMLLNDQDGDFTLNAKMGAMDAVFINPMIEPMALAKVDKGKIQSLSYQLAANKMHGVGNLTFLYSDAKLILLKKDDADNKYKTKILTTLAAGLIIKDSNPAKGEIRVSRVDFGRDRHRSIFHLMWRSLYAAIRKTAGMK
jgi:hypothetical protein